MSLRRLRAGELLVLLGVIGLVVSLFASWFDVQFAADEVLRQQPAVGSAASFLDVSGSASSGWNPLGDPWREFLVIAGIAWLVVLAFALTSGSRRSTYGAVVSIVVAIPVTALILLLTLIRTLLASPSASLRDSGLTGFGNLDRLGDPDATVLTTSPAIGTWIGLASLLIGLIGLWVAMADDRSTAAESVAVPRPDVSAVPPVQAAPQGTPASGAPPSADAGPVPTDAPPAPGDAQA